MNTGRRYGEQPEQSGGSEGNVNSVTSTQSMTSTPASMSSGTMAEPALYANFAEWLDRDLSRLEDIYKGWATAGYGQWRRTFKTAR